MKKLSVLLAGIALLASSCSTYYHAPAMYQNDVQYMAKPNSKDSVKHGTYASGVLMVHSTGDNDATGSGGLLNIYQSHTFQNINLSYGVLGFAGNYSGGSTTTYTINNKTTTNDNTYSKDFFGLGANASISGYIPFEHVDWRVLGVDLVYTKEFGDYLDYRRAGINTSDDVYVRQSKMFTYGLFTEISAKPSDKVTLNFKLGINRSTGEVARISNRVFNNGNFFAAIGVNHLVFIGAIKFKPTDVIAEPTGMQLGAAYRF